MSFVFDPPRYAVEAQWGGKGGGGWVTVYTGNDWIRAANSANFWDERVNVRWYDFQRLPWRQQLAFKFDALDRYIRAGAKPPRRKHEWWTEAQAVESILT